MAQQRGGIVTVGRRDSDAKAGTDQNVVPVETIGCAQGSKQAAAKRFGVSRLRGADLHDRELVTTQPGHRVGVARAAAQALGHLAQQEVADCVAQGIVHFLEAIEVETDHGRRVAMTTSMNQRLGQPLGQEDPIGQVGQRVVQGKVTGTRLGAGEVL